MKINNPVFILGAQKSGTTTLFDILCGVSIFSPSRVKEIGYFSKNHFYEQGVDWYLRNFDLNSKKFIIEATPEYIYYPYVAERIFKFNSESRFVVVLREPASRAYSAWSMFKRFNKDAAMARSVYENFTVYADPPIRCAIASLLFSEKYPDFSAAVRDDIARCHESSSLLEPSFVRRGLYFRQIQAYLNYFERDRFLFLEQSELSDSEKLQEKLNSFFGVHFEIDKSIGASNKGVYETVDRDDLEVIDQLKIFYKPYNEILFDFLGGDFDRFNW